jgi:hypothetical protein
MELASENKDLKQYARHTVLLQTYEQILHKYEASRRYHVQ